MMDFEPGIQISIEVKLDSVKQTSFEIPLDPVEQTSFEVKA